MGRLRLTPTGARFVVFLVASVLVTVGAALVFVPAGLIVAGLCVGAVLLIEV